MMGVSQDVSQDVITPVVIFDYTPNSDQKKINIVVRPSNSVGKVISDVVTLYRYDNFDLILQPTNTTFYLVHLNKIKYRPIFDIPGFEPLMRNTLILMPPGMWDGNVKQRFDVPLSSKTMPPSLTTYIAALTNNNNSNSSSNSTSTTSKNNTNNNNNNVTVTTTSTSSSNRRVKKDEMPLELTPEVEMDAAGGYERNMSSPLTTMAGGHRAMVNTVSSSTMSGDGDVDGDVDEGGGISGGGETFNLSPMSDPEQLSDDDLALGASASPTETDHINGGPLSLAHTSPSSTQHLKFEDECYAEICPNSQRDRPFSGGFDSNSMERKYGISPLTSSALPNSLNSGFVGLVNQAMTCYLNSLLQALFMTPEFRNALYRWESDNENEAKNIPYQLQKLFLKLQTSKKAAVETTSLTRSFGWDSSEAWQQQDIQELCRVMFDALEHKFRNTKQANLIANLYEGKMIDYVKCLDCNTEKTRADTFLDIPLPVRSFGSGVAYGSIEEALNAFVQPETLDGNNQYFCEKCNRKCDAHKGLKFKNFPYILTLHLKRFDFDYTTMHRIKLNDRLSFPETMNLNGFVQSEAMMNNGGNSGTNGASFVINNMPGVTTNDDCSTTDSGSAMEEDNLSSGVTTTTNSSQHENDHDQDIEHDNEQENEMNDEDEGIDMSSHTDSRTPTITGTSTNHAIGSSISSSSSSSGNTVTPTGPYIYELFAIMIHSGSASGGHYYAYIKDFQKNEWFCFNDQSVTPITNEDIEKTYGGGFGGKAYYSTVYSSSTNAYMLMYRQIDPKRNERIMKEDEFPPHLQQMLKNMQEMDESAPSSSRSNTASGLASDLVNPWVYFYNPLQKKLTSTLLYSQRPFNLNNVLKSAYNILNVEEFAPLSHCRLVAYEPRFQQILFSFDILSNDPTLTAAYRGSCDFLLEYHAEGQEFDVYKPDGSTWNVYTVNMAKVEIDGPYLVHSSSNVQNEVLLHSIAKRLHVKDSQLLLATLKHEKAFVAYDPHPTKEAQDALQNLVNTTFKNITYIYLDVPNTDPATLQFLEIPPYEPSTANSLSAKPTTTVPAPALAQPPASASTPTVTPTPTPTTTPAAKFNYDEIYDILNVTSHKPVIGDSISVTASMPATPTSSMTTITTSSSCSSNGYLTATSSDGMGRESRQESNSEDSSLSDGDRTLVESLHNPGGGGGGGGAGGVDSQISSTSHSPQLSSPEDEASNESYNRIDAFFNGSMNHIEPEPVNSINSSNSNQSHYFFAIKTTSRSQQNTSSSGGATSSGAETDESLVPFPAHTYKILVDSNMKLTEFKQHIESLIHVPANYFKIHTRLVDDFSVPQLPVSLSDGQNFVCELGRCLQSHEFKAKISFIRLSDIDNEAGKLTRIFDWVYSSTTTVAEAKKELVSRFHNLDPVKYKTLTVQNARLWLKGSRNPIRILQDDETLMNEYHSFIATEFMVQECEDGVNPQPDPDSLTLFVRRWHADKIQLDKFQEITLDKNSEIRAVLAKITDINEEHIAYSRIGSGFPCTNLPLFTLNSVISWFSIPATLDKYPLTISVSGNVYFYKDVTKAPKELSTEERRDCMTKEKARLDRIGCFSIGLFSGRRERALKIYLDSPQAPDSPPTLLNNESGEDGKKKI